jgi:signal transduction histidine kinase
MGPTQDQVVNVANPLRRHRVLIVDDNAAIHEDIRKILCPPEPDPAFREAKALLFGAAAGPTRSVRFELDSAFQGADGLELAQRAAAAGDAYALAFVDVRMPPGMDGVETVAKLWEVCPDLQAVLCTAYSDYTWPEIFTRLRHTDSLVILKKPFDTIEVLQLAHALAEKWRLGREMERHLAELDGLVRQRTAELLAVNEQLVGEIAEQRRLEAGLLQAQKMEAVGHLAAGIAHDFNNILQVIQGYADLLLERAAAEGDERKALERILVSTARAGELVRHLLTFSQKAVPRFQELDVRDTLSTLAGTLTRQLPANLALTVTAAPDLPLVLADAGMMEQLLASLALNARDAMPDGGRLEISADRVVLDRAEAQPERTGTFLRLTVADNGQGMDTGVRAHLFEPFYTTKPVGHGTGLGLAIVYGIVRQHGGWVEVDSRPGKGTTFRVFLPALKSLSH